MLLCLFSAQVLAQDQAPSPDQMITQMQSKLNLSKDQVAAITPIIQKYIPQFEELLQSMGDGTSDPNDIRQQMRKLRQEEKQELSQVLSEQQLSQWQSLMKKNWHHANNPPSSQE